MDRETVGRRGPDARGYFGAYGGRFVPETLVAPIEELTAGYLAARADAGFRDELNDLLKHYVGRPTPLYETRRLGDGRRPPHVVLQQPRELRLETRIAPDVEVRAFQLFDRLDERFGHVAPAEVAEIAAGVRIAP